MPPVTDGSVRSRGFGRALLRRLPLIGTMLGLGLGAWLVATNDLGKIGDAFVKIGWLGLAGIVLVRIGSNLLCSIAWGCLLERLAPVEMATFLKLRFVREGINNLLPVASVGGDLMGGRLLTFWGVAGALAVASILVDMLIQVGTQVLFAFVGVLLLMQIDGEDAATMASRMLYALAIAAALLTGFFLVQRVGTARVVERLLADAVRRLAGGGAPEDRRDTGQAGIQEALDALWAPDRVGRLVWSIVLHFAAWVLAAAEIWIALACIGVEVSLTEVIVLESLAQAIKSAAFPVPSGLGVQEGGFVLVGAIVGVDPDTAIALSLAKRVPDVVLGLPSLLYWQRLEARRVAVMQAPAR